ncbi:cytoplasmic membrane protein [Leptospira interrogans serovar Hardjo str. Norma]|uniref:Cytoplasmic membrane protein n=1 Tax=Leptospira interrogans serovar Hardjo str. Norma TaxID=1279460 RepID=A0A0M3TL97_LEPIR|nr:cytoplasmic membrane protein [Leptospira interrogans serovar Hardjo str. Norma]OOB95444.1 hypothetical protein B0191_08030 [Leptospira interrogans serovar Hardjo]
MVVWKLASNLPEEVGELHNLEELSLSRNLLITLPKEIRRLQNLQVLNLSDNRPTFTVLPKEIGKLRNLKELDLSSNSLSVKEKKRIRKLLPKCSIIYF